MSSFPAVGVVDLVDLGNRVWRERTLEEPTGVSCPCGWREAQLSYWLLYFLAFLVGLGGLLVLLLFLNVNLGEKMREFMYIIT